MAFHKIIDKKLENDEKHIELIVYKVENKFAEIPLNAEIKNLEKDMENISEQITIEEDLCIFKDEMDEVSTLLDERIEIEKETLNLKSYNNFLRKCY